MSSVGKVESLFVYPGKSLRGFPVPESDVRTDGPAGDREFLVVDDAGRFLTQRTLSVMNRIGLRRDGGAVVLTFGDRSLTVPIVAWSEESDVTVWNSVVNARRVGAAADGFLSAAIGKPARLFEYLPSSPRELTWRSPEPFETRFTDSAPVLLTAQESLEALGAAAGVPLSIDRFRPNIHVSGFPAWSEEKARRIRVGGAELEVLDVCTRCKIITLDPVTGAADQVQLLPLLKSSVKGEQKAANFGVRCKVLKPGVVRPGDPVEF